MLSLVLLITSAALKLWEGKQQLSIAENTVIEVDPDIENASRLRRYAQKLLKHSTKALQKFPGNEVFNWERELNDQNKVKLLYRLAELNDFAREYPEGRCIGYLSVIIVEMNLVALCVEVSFWVLQYY